MPKKKVKKIKKKKVAARKKVAPKKKRPTIKKRSVKKKPARAAVRRKFPKPIGTVTHFYNEISVAIVRFKEPVSLGTVLYFKGATTDFKHPVKSMQYNHAPVAVAPKGKQIGIKVPKRVREGDKVHRA